MEFSEKAKENTRKYGIDLPQVEAAVEPVPAAASYSKNSLRAPWGETYTLHASGQYPSHEFPEGDGPYYVVTLTRGQEGEETVLSTHAVPTSILADRQHGKPLEMLRRLANDPSFRVEVSVWGNPGAHLQGATIAPADGQGVQAQDGSEERIVLEDLARLHKGLVQILLAFAVDATAVREHLGLG